MTIFAETAIQSTTQQNVSTEQNVCALMLGDENVIGAKCFFYHHAANKPDSIISEKDSLVQLVIDKNQLTLSFLNQNSGIYSSRLFNIDPNNYKYSWYNGKLTTQEIKSRIRLVPYVYGKYRPFNNLWDLGTGISIETKRFNYKLGINSFYYPRYFSGIKTDLELVVTYKF